jgi:hypothetical protein
MHVTAVLDDAPTQLDDPIEEHLDLIEQPDGDVVIPSAYGPLILRPDQEEFTDQQREALDVIGIKTSGPDAVPPAVLRVFFHNCLVRGFDPFAGDATIMWTEDGPVWIAKIDGLRKAAIRTGEYEGQDDPAWADEEGTWHEVWLPSLGRPVAARVGVYRTGFRKAMTAVAHTDEHQVRERKYEEVNGRRRFKGWGLAERWQDGKGVCFMIAKCAEAAAFRKAFPKETAGFYVQEEVDRLREQRRQAREAAAAAESARLIREAYEAAHPSQAEPGEPLVGVVVEHQGEPVEPEATEPTPTVPQQASAAQRVAELREAGRKSAAEAAAAVAPEQEQEAVLPLTKPSDESQRAEMLRQLLVEHADILGVELAKLTARWAARAGQPFELWPVETLLAVKAGTRDLVIARLRQQGRDDEAAAYSQWAPVDVYPVDEMFGRVRTAA